LGHIALLVDVERQNLLHGMYSKEQSYLYSGRKESKVINGR